MISPAFRFAPSPNGELHLGHAYSALLNAQMAANVQGRFLLRIEDIDTTRCTPEFEQAIYRDLEWLGLTWEQPVRRQSQHFADYSTALTQLIDAELVYPSFLSRGETRAIIADAQANGQKWPHDPDGAPLFPEIERQISQKERKSRMNNSEPFAWRINVEAALASLGSNADELFWQESGTGPDCETGKIAANPIAWGDVVIARKEIPTSYHLAVVVDDALQGISHVVRGLDLFHATAIQRLLQELLGLSAPLYHHHRLILNDDGCKLSKSKKDTGLNELRKSGMSLTDIKHMIGLTES